MKRDTNVHVREGNRTHQCYFSWKCKDRGDVVVSMQNRRTPHDIHLCEDHAKNIMAALLGHYGAGQDVQGMIETANIIMKRQNALIMRVLDNKPRNLTFNVVEALLKESGYTDEDLKGLRLKGTEEAIKMYLGYDTRDFTPGEKKIIQTEDRIAEKKEELEEELASFDPGIDDDEIDDIDNIDKDNDITDDIGFVLTDEDDIDPNVVDVIEEADIVIDDEEAAQNLLDALEEAAEEEGVE